MNDVVNTQCNKLGFAAEFQWWKRKLNVLQLEAPGIGC